jgi:hypothetical protein
MQKVKRFGVLSVAKLQSAVMGVMGLIFGLIYGAIAAVTGIIALISGSKAGILALVGAVAAVILFPLFYAAIGFVFGALSTWVYNIVAGRIGGIELELE